MSDRRASLLAALVLASAGAGSCFAGKTTEPGTATRNVGTASLVTAREHAGGKNEGPLGWTTAISRSALYEELGNEGIRAETLGPLNQIRDPHVLLAVMDTFTRALDVRCTWCHLPSDYSAPTARKAAAAYMWDAFVAQLELVDGAPLYCDSCHHQSTVFLHRSERHEVAKYMQSEYVDQLRRRDGREHGCATCHANPFNPRFLPRIDDPAGFVAPAAHPGPQK